MRGRVAHVPRPRAVMTPGAPACPRAPRARVGLEENALSNLPGRILLRPFVALALVAFVVALTGVGTTISARPPSTPSPVPAEAFRPVALQGLYASQAPGSLAHRVPIGDLVEPDPSPTPGPTAPAGPVHVVRNGDTLWQIAAWHRADLDLILLWNPNVDPRRLVAGQRVLVPGGRPMASPTPTSDTKRPGSTTLGGRHLWPLPVRGTITTYFSASHPGIDIAARAGTTVRAIAPGTVTWAGWKDTGGGYVVVIRHPDGMVSTYNHNRKVVVRVGQVVGAGEKIAEVGSTGWSTGPHLDLRIQMGAEPINPLRLSWTR